MAGWVAKRLRNSALMDTFHSRYLCTIFLEHPPLKKPPAKPRSHPIYAIQGSFLAIREIFA